MDNQNEEDKILYFPICPECNEIASIDYISSFNIKVICGIYKTQTVLSIEKIK